VVHHEVKEHADAGGVSPACVSSRRRFTGWWEYMLDDAIFTAPPRGELKQPPARGAAAACHGRKTSWE
jgi:hypothetical protein